MIQTRTLGTMTILELHGALNAGGADSGLRTAVRLALDGGALAVILNLQDVAAVDSSGIAQLASAHMTTANHGGRVKLCCLSRKLKDVFIITRLNTVFDAYDTEADAIASANARM